jgi:hypothetical protein
MKAIIKHFAETKRLIRFGEYCGVKRRWFESNKSYRKRMEKIILGVVK